MCRVPHFNFVYTRIKVDTNNWRKQKKKNQQKFCIVWWVKNQNQERENARSRRPLLNITTPFDFLHYSKHTDMFQRERASPLTPTIFHTEMFSIKQHTRFNFWWGISYFTELAASVPKTIFSFHSWQFFREIYISITIAILKLYN